MVRSDGTVTLVTRVDWKCQQYYYVFADGTMHGEFKEVDKKGRLLEKCYFNNGVLEGLYTSWYKNGEKKKMCVYIDGKKEGCVKRWDKLGNAEEDEFYQEGEKINKHVFK